MWSSNHSRNVKSLLSVISYFHFYSRFSYLNFMTLFLQVYKKMQQISWPSVLGQIICEFLNQYRGISFLATRFRSFTPPEISKLILVSFCRKILHMLIYLHNVENWSDRFKFGNVYTLFESIRVLIYFFCLIILLPLVVDITINRKKYFRMDQVKFVEVSC